MRKGWESMRLTNFVWFQRGFDLPRNNFVEGNVPVYGSTSILGYHNVSKVKAPGIITGRSGTLGKFQFANEDFWPHNTSLWVKDFKDNDEKFAYYLLQTLDFTLFNSGGAVPTLNRNLLTAYIVNVPPLETQRKIATILSGYDDLIENNLKRIKILEEMAQQTYEEWFVRMRFPGYETAVMNEETGLAEGWETVKLGEIYDLKYGKNLPQTDILKEGTFSVYGASGKMGYFTKSNISSKKVLVTSRGNGSGVVHRTFEDESFVTNNSFVVNTELGLGYTFYNLKKFDLSRFNSGSAQPQLTNSALLNVEIIRPNSQLINDFNLIGNKQIQFIDNLLNQNQRLREARDLLLPRLMMGIVEV